jgi:ferredoxin
VTGKESNRIEREEKMRVRVDEELCVGDGTCVEVCPEIFEMRGDVAVAKMAEVPEEIEDSCREAADSCPVEAILIEE